MVLANLGGPKLPDLPARVGDLAPPVEADPSLGGVRLLMESFSGATPALAPGTMIQLGLTPDPVSKKTVLRRTISYKDRKFLADFESMIDAGRIGNSMFWSFYRTPRVTLFPFRYF